MDDQDQGEYTELPQYFIRKKPDENLAVFTKREGTDFISGLMRDILGVTVEESDNGNPIYKISPNSLVNLEGAHRIHLFLKQNINVVTTLTQWDEEQVKIQTRELGFALALLIWGNNEEMGLDEKLLLTFCEGMIVTIHAQLNRAKNGRENEFISAPPVQQTMTYNMQNKQRSWLEKMTGKKEEAPGVIRQ